jgi:hypothetical protein
MYDRDLRAWYRDLFLYPSAKKRTRNRPVLDVRAPVARARRLSSRDGAANEAFTVGIEGQRASDPDPAITLR